IDVDHVHPRIFEQLLEIRISRLNSECIADGIQLFSRPLANCVHVGTWMPLINGNEFRSESEANNGYVDFLHALRSRRAIVRPNSLRLCSGIHPILAASVKLKRLRVALSKGRIFESIAQLCFQFGV